MCETLKWEMPKCWCGESPSWVAIEDACCVGARSNGKCKAHGGL